MTIFHRSNSKFMMLMLLLVCSHAALHRSFYEIKEIREIRSSLVINCDILLNKIQLLNNTNIKLYIYIYSLLLIRSNINIKTVYMAQLACPLRYPKHK